MFLIHQLFVHRHPFCLFLALEDPFSTYSFPLLLSSTRPRSSLFFPSTTIHYPILYPCDCYLITKLISQPTKAFLVLQQSFSPSHGVVGLLDDLHDCDDQGRYNLILIVVIDSCICDLRLLDRCILDSACPSDDLYQNHCVSVRLLRDFDQSIKILLEMIFRSFESRNFGSSFFNSFTSIFKTLLLQCPVLPSIRIWCICKLAVLLWLISKNIFDNWPIGWICVPTSFPAIHFFYRLLIRVYFLFLKS